VLKLSKGIPKYIGSVEFWKIVEAYFSQSGLSEKTGVKNIHATSHRVEKKPCILSPIL